MAEEFAPRNLEFAFMAAIVARADGRLEITDRELVRLPSLEVRVWHDDEKQCYVVEARKEPDGES